MPRLLRPADLLALDPGKHQTAHALFQAGRLVRVGFELPWRMRHVVCERPEYQGDRTERVRMQDVIDLSIAAGDAARNACCDGADPEWFTPSQWKGQESKACQHARLWETLSPSERRLLGGAETGRIIYAAREAGALDRWKPGKTYYPSTFKTHNLLDSVALGAWRVGRFRTRGKIKSW